MNNLNVTEAKKYFEMIKSVDDSGIESWSARDLMSRLGYDRWENFLLVIKKAIIASKNSGFDSDLHFRDVTKTSPMPNGGFKRIKDYKLSRYGCYLIAQNGDSTKEQIALAQTYFAFQTRKQEVAQENAKELERLSARDKLSTTEKNFSGVMFDQGITGVGIAKIRARGDKKLFGGNTTDDMKRKLDVPAKRPLADFLPTITIKAKDLATEMTTFKTKEKALKYKESIATTHETHNTSVRQVLVKEGIYPESLPKEEDIRKLERKRKRDQKQLAPAKKPFKINSGFDSAMKKIVNADLQEKDKSK